MVGAIKRKDEFGGARHVLDKFYTKDNVALPCIGTIESLIEHSDIIVEPSAGGGAFSRQITHPNVKAFDLEPEDSSVIKENWFDVSRSMLGEGSLLVIGNPPFGVRSDLAKRFIKHAVSLDAETIAFILPETFSKALNQKVSLFPEYFRLVVENKIGVESFTVEGESLHIPCRWFVWTKNVDFMEGVDLRKNLIPESPDFMFMPRGSVEADFTVNGNSGKIRTLNEVTNPKAEHYIKVSDRVKVDEVREVFENLVFDFNSSVNGGVAWIGKQEILSAYANYNLKN